MTLGIGPIDIDPIEVIIRVTLYIHDEGLNLYYRTVEKKIKEKVTIERPKVRSRLHYDVAQLQALTNVPIKYQLQSSYGFQDMA